MQLCAQSNSGTEEQKRRITREVVRPALVGSFLSELARLQHLQWHSSLCSPSSPALGEKHGLGCGSLILLIGKPDGRTSRLT